MAAPGRGDHNVLRLLDQRDHRAAAHGGARGARRREDATSVWRNSRAAGFRRDQDRLSSPDRLDRTVLVGTGRSQIHGMTVEAHTNARVGAEVEHRPAGGHRHADAVVAHDLRRRSGAAGSGERGAGREIGPRRPRHEARSRQPCEAADVACGAAPDHDTTDNSMGSGRFRPARCFASTCSRPCGLPLSMRGGGAASASCPGCHRRTPSCGPRCRAR